MKTIGLLGGMSWESTVTYYQIINTVVRERLGGLHSAKCVLYSVDFDEIEACQSSGDWARSAEILSAAAQALERAGADFIVLCTNTMHKVAPEISARCGVPVLHIAEVTAPGLQRPGRGDRGPAGHPVHHGAGLLSKSADRCRRPGADSRRGGPGSGKRRDFP